MPAAASEQTESPTAAPPLLGAAARGDQRGFDAPAMQKSSVLPRWWLMGAVQAS